MVSCKTYDQKPLVNGSRLSVDSVHDVVGLKFSSLFNSDLAWKSSAKGSRSSSRRARSSVSRSWNAGKEVKKTDFSAVEIPFSESEKLGVSVLGCHFNENADHVPIKKRKLTFVSESSTTKAPPTHTEENRRLSNCQPEAVSYATCSSVDTADMKHDVNENKLGKDHDQNNDKEDFSGMLILAAAACSDSCGEANGHIGERLGVEESYGYEGPCVNNKLHSSSKRVLQDDSSSPGMTRATGSVMKEVKETDGISHQDDHSNWNVNTFMDTSTCPVDYQCSNSNNMDGIPSDVKFGNCGDKNWNSESKAVHGETVDSICHTERGLAPSDPGVIGQKEHFSKNKECKSDSLTCIDRSSCCQGKLNSGYVDFVSTESVTPVNDRIKSDSAQCLTSSCTGNSEGTSLQQFKESDSFVQKSLPSRSNQTLQTSESVCDAASTSSTGVTFAKNVDGRVASIHQAVSSVMQTDEMELTPRVSSSSITFCDTRDVLSKDSLGFKENSLCQLTELPDSPPAVKMSTLPQDLEVQRDIAVEHDDKNAYETNSEDVVSGNDRIAINEHAGDCRDSDVCHAVHAYAKAIGCEVDYDSQYEDGELRESMEHPWQGYGGEDSEVEQVDYRSDSDTLGFQSERATACVQGTDLQTNASWLKGEDAESVGKTGDIIYKVVASKEIKGGRMSAVKSDRMIGHSYAGRRNINNEDVVRLDTMDQTRMAESIASRWNMSSLVKEEQKFDDYSFRKGRYSWYYHARARGGDQAVDSQDGSGSTNHNRTPIKMSYHHLRPANDMRPHLTRLESPYARDEPPGTQLHSRMSRKPSSGWHATPPVSGRSARYGLQRAGRGHQSYYRGTGAGDFGDLSFSGSHHSVTRSDRSFNPIKRSREPRVHRSRSRSSSRSRSHSSSSRNQGVRCRGRSPNFRSTIRMQKRTPGQKPHLLADHVGGFSSGPKCHDSAQNTPYGERKDDAAYCGERSYNKHSSFLRRRSQGNFDERDHRIDFAVSPRTVRFMHRGRFMDVNAGDWRHAGRDYERGKHQYRYETDEHVKRCRYNGDDVYNSRCRDVAELVRRGSLNSHRRMDSQIGERAGKFRGDDRRNREQYRYQRESE